MGIKQCLQHGYITWVSSNTSKGDRNIGKRDIRTVLDVKQEAVYTRTKRIKQHASIEV